MFFTHLFCSCKLMFLLQRNQVIVMEKMCGKHHYERDILREGIGQWLLLTLFTQNVTFPQVLSLCRNQPIDLQSKIAEQICGPSFFINRSNVLIRVIAIFETCFWSQFFKLLYKGRPLQSKPLRTMGGWGLSSTIVTVHYTRVNGQEKCWFLVLCNDWMTANLIWVWCF